MKQPTDCLMILNPHLVDFVDRERLSCTFTMRHNQFQMSVTIEICSYSSWKAIKITLQKRKQPLITAFLMPWKYSCVNSLCTNDYELKRLRKHISQMELYYHLVVGCAVTKYNMKQLLQSLLSQLYLE